MLYVFSLRVFFLDVKGKVGSNRMRVHSQISWKRERKCSLQFEPARQFFLLSQVRELQKKRDEPQEPIC